MNLVDYEVCKLLGVIHYVIKCLSSSDILEIELILFAHNSIMTSSD